MVSSCPETCETSSQDLYGTNSQLNIMFEGCVAAPCVPDWCFCDSLRQSLWQIRMRAAETTMALLGLLSQSLEDEETES